MANSLADQLEQDMECEGLLECIHGLKELDRRCFEVLVTSDDPLTVDEVAAAVDRERSTAYRAIRRLERAGFVTQTTVSASGSGYYYVYSPADPGDIAEEMRHKLEAWQEKLSLLIEEFEKKYDDQIEREA